MHTNSISYAKRYYGKHDTMSNLYNLQKMQTYLHIYTAGNAYSILENISAEYFPRLAFIKH